MMNFFTLQLPSLLLDILFILLEKILHYNLNLNQYFSRIKPINIFTDP